MEQLGSGLGPRDRSVLEATAHLRLVTGGQLQRLVFSGPAATSTNDRIARRVLQRLTDQHLLQRLQRRLGGLRAGSSSYVYALTPLGAVAIGRQLGRSRSRQPSLTFLGHSLAVAEVYVRLHESRNRGALASLSVDTEPACWRPLEDGTGSTLKPDLFVIAGRQQDEQLAFVEVDNGTEHAAALTRKLVLYRAHYAAGTEQQIEGVFPEVLWTAASEQRRAQLDELFARRGESRLHRALSTDDFISYLQKGGDHA